MKPRTAISEQPVASALVLTSGRDTPAHKPVLEPTIKRGFWIIHSKLDAVFIDNGPALVSWAFDRIIQELKVSSNDGRPVDPINRPKHA